MEKVQKSPPKIKKNIYLAQKLRKLKLFKFKKFWIWSEGGGWKFSKSSEIQKVLNYPSLFGNFFPNFPGFYSDASPRSKIWRRKNKHGCNKLRQNHANLVLYVVFAIFMQSFCFMSVWYCLFFFDVFILYVVFDYLII